MQYCNVLLLNVTSPNTGSNVPIKLQKCLILNVLWTCKMSIVLFIYYYLYVLMCYYCYVNIP